ncbi:hypothetical protein [Halorientalis sp. IM1011]|nr:hypothetical protein [Halorientalis sp. IM1011]
MIRTLTKLLKLGLVGIGLLTVLFVVFSYGWNGEPPTVELE